MNIESVRENINIFRAFSEGMHNDNLERFVETLQASPLQRACNHSTV